MRKEIFEKAIAAEFRSQASDGQEAARKIKNTGESQLCQEGGILLREGKGPQDEQQGRGEVRTERELLPNSSVWPETEAEGMRMMVDSVTSPPPSPQQQRGDII